MAKSTKKGDGAAATERKASRPRRESLTVEQGDPADYTPEKREGLTPSEAAKQMVADGTAELEAREPGPTSDDIAQEAKRQAEERGEYEEGHGIEDDDPAPEDAEGQRLEELGLDPENTLVQVTVDGESREVSLEEAARGYQRQEAFTRKTQELAEQRRELEAAAEQVGSDLQALALMGDHMSPEQQEALAAKMAQYEQLTAVTKTEHLSVEKERLQQALGWESSDEAREGAQQIREYVTSAYGFEDTDLNNVSDHRVLVMAEKARRWDEMQGTAEAIKSQKRDPSPTLRPGISSLGKRQSRSDKALRSAQERLRRSGSKRDAVDVILSSGLLD